jgi:hypothetical protein
MLPRQATIVRNHKIMLTIWRRTVTLLEIRAPQCEPERSPQSSPTTYLTKGFVMASTPGQTFGDRLRKINDLRKEVEAANAAVVRAAQARSEARSARRSAYFGDARQGVPGLATLVRRVRDTVASMRGGKNLPS